MMSWKISLVLLLNVCLLPSLFAQADRWQQHITYDMEVDFDVTNHQFTGNQKMVYTNNSPEALSHVYFHLYLNAFQPGSVMYHRTQAVPDPDRRISGRIERLSPKEIGFTMVKSLTMDGQPTQYHAEGTILEVKLPTPIQPGQKVTLVMDYQSQVPIQIRRNGRDNAEGISYSMSQWYPKMCEYDYQGWHANPYIGKEFYGVWGDFDVKITIDKNYIVAAGGYLQNPEEIGYGYEDEGQQVKRPAGDKLTYHFKAPKVHDFVWAADPDYTHTKLKRKDGTMLHFFYQKNEKTKAWSQLPKIMDEAFNFIEENFGEYPYQSYAYIQGGDGGMEYPMGTLITGHRPLISLVGVSVHEQMHTWYQMLLGTNESLYPWMDEGMTSYTSTLTMDYLAKKGLLGASKPKEDPFTADAERYIQFSKSGMEEPLSTHSDHYRSNAAYWMGAYTKGELTIRQLEYIIGSENVAVGMRKYYDMWKYKHPNPNDFFRVMEIQSGLELDWYKEYWIQTTHTIDYQVKSVSKESRKETKVKIQKVGEMPMPLDVVVTYKNGDKEVYYIPLDLMRGEKQGDILNSMDVKLMPDWPWIMKEYEFTIPAKKKKIQSVEIDPSNRMIDVNRDNNYHEVK